MNTNVHVTKLNALKYKCMEQGYYTVLLIEMILISIFVQT